MSFENLTVIIPAFRSHKLLRACLASIKSANHGFVEQICVVDSENHSITKDLCLENNASYFNIKLNNISAKRNFGAKQATAGLLLFLDADCQISQDTLLKAAEVFQERPQVVGLGNKVFTLPSNASETARLWQISAATFNRHAQQSAAWLPAACLFVRAKAFRQAGGFKETLTAGEDAEFTARLFKVGKLIHDPSLFYIHQKNPADLGEFYLKEYWRAEHAFATAQTTLSFKSATQILLPVYGLLLLVVPIIILLLSNAFLMIALLLIALSPIIALSAHVALQGSSQSAFFKLIPIYLAYIIARTLALFSSLLKG